MVIRLAPDLPVPDFMKGSIKTMIEFAFHETPRSGVQVNVVPGGKYDIHCSGIAWNGHNPNLRHHLKADRSIPILASTKRLVTIRIPPNLFASDYPRKWCYEKFNGPIRWYSNGYESLVTLAAHEARHIYQYTHGLYEKRGELKESELDAEDYAGQLLWAWRQALK